MDNKIITNLKNEDFLDMFSKICLIILQSKSIKHYWEQLEKV